MNSTTVPEWVPYATIGLSSMAIVVSVLGLIFTIVKSYRVEGGRVVISFDPAIWEPGTVLVRQRSKDGSIPSITPSDWMSSGTNDRGVECAIVEVENAGRVGVTILEVGIAFKGRRLARKSWKRERGHIVPRTFRSRSFSVGTFDSESKSIRLEPYSHAVYLMDVHSVIAAARKAVPQRRNGTPKDIKLRASVKVAGRKKPALSRRRRQWRIAGDAVSLLNHSATIRVESLIVLQLARQFNFKPNPDEDNSEIGYLSRFIAASLWDTRDNEDIDDRIDTALNAEWEIRNFLADEPGRYSLQYELGVMLRTRADVLDWTGASKQSKLLAERRRREERRAAKPDDPNQWLP